MLKPTIKIPIPKTEIKTVEMGGRRGRPQTDFVTEIIYLPTKRNKLVALALVFFVYIFFAPRFFGIVNLIKNTTEEVDSFVRYRSSITQLSKEYNVPAALVAAMIKVESDFRPNVVSPVGARGLMQVMPATARELNVHNINDPHENIRAGTKYIRSLLDQFRGNMTLAIASYNAGPGAVKKFGAVPPYPETRKYVQKVLHHFQQFKRNFGA